MKTDKEFRPWRPEWTSEHVKRFWDWWGSNPALLKHYFSKRNGAAVLDQVGRYAKFSEIVVDLGAGPGFIVELLVRRDIKTIAVDTSPDSLAALEQRMKGFRNFLGTRVSKANRVPIDNNQANVVLLPQVLRQYLINIGFDEVVCVSRHCFHLSHFYLESVS